MPLLLDLLRHGVAAPDHERGDEFRPLTPKGENAIRDLARRLAALPERPGRIFASPLVRARQTAEIVSAAWPAPASVETLVELEPDRDPSDPLEALEVIGIETGHVLLVGHQPLLGRLAIHLSGAESRFSPGTLVRLECPNGPRPGARLLLALQAHNP